MGFIDKELFNEAESLNESLFKKRKKKYVTPTKEDYDKAYRIAKKLISKNSLLKKSCTIIPYKIDNENPYEVKVYEFDYTIRKLPNLEGDEWNNFIQEIVPEFQTEITNELKKYDIEFDWIGTKDGYAFIQKYEYPLKEKTLKEEYKERRKLDMGFKDNTLLHEENFMESLRANIKKRQEMQEAEVKDILDAEELVDEGKLVDSVKAKIQQKEKEKKQKENVREKEKLKEKKEKDEKIDLSKKKPPVKTENMSMAQQYNYIIKEYYDITDTDTRKILVSVSEADKNQVLSSLTNKLYNDIVDKVDDIDFGTIPMSKGDITKIDNYDRLCQCISTINKIMEEYHQDTKNNMEVITSAIDNLIRRKDLFVKSFQMNLELPMIIYSTIALSIVSSVSFMISSCIEFVKSPSKDSFDVEIDKVALNKTKDNVLFDNLKKFNESCRKGQIDKTIDFVIKNNVKNFTGYEVGLVLSGIALIGIILNIIPILRELIFFFYYSRVKVSDYFEVQADLLQINAYNVESNSALSKDDRTKIVKKQMKIVDTFRKIANTIGIDNKSSEVKATKEIAKTSKEKYKYSDLNDSLPDSVASDIF